MNSDQFEDVKKVIMVAEPLGSRRLSNGVQLIGNIPHLAPEAYLHVLFPPLNDEQLAILEQQVQRPLPSALRSFYMHSNGICLFAYNLSIYGFHRSYVRKGDDAWQPFSLHTPNVDERPADADDSFVLFGGYKWDGSLLGMYPDSEHVYLCTRESTTPLMEWSGLGDMLISEVHRLRDLFDATGHRIDEDESTLPI